jgi:protein-tyrosine phosphatase
MSNDLPIVSHIHGNIWQGASVAEFGFEMSPYFKSILNLYPWMEYEMHPRTVYRSTEMHDNHSGVDEEKVWDLAHWVDNQASVGPVLVHCQAGVNRSSLVVGAALVLQGMTGKEALETIRRKRGPECCCNKVFEKWLLSQ